MTGIPGPRTDELSERAGRITRDRSYDELKIARDIVLNDAPVFAHGLMPFRFGPEGNRPHAVDWVEIAIVTTGSGYFLSPRGPTRVGPGTVMVLRPGVWSSSVDCDLESASLGISPVALATDLAFLRRHGAARDLLFPSARTVGGVFTGPVDVDAALEFAAEVATLERLLAAAAPDSVVILGRVIVAIGILADALPDPERGRIRHPAVEATLELLEAEPERAWRLDDLARTVNLETSYLVRLFRTEVGAPPMAHLAGVRIERAAALLAERRLSVGEVGAAVGWPDSAHFSRRFRALMGMSPRRYRDEVRRPSA